MWLLYYHILHKSGVFNVFQAKDSQTDGEMEQGPPTNQKFRDPPPPPLQYLCGPPRGRSSPVEDLWHKLLNKYIKCISFKGINNKSITSAVEPSISIRPSPLLINCYETDH